MYLQNHVVLSFFTFPRNIVVFRVGGTSADATVVSVRCGLYHILSTANRLSLGGDKITELLSEHLAEEFKR